MNTNVLYTPIAEQTSSLLQTISAPARLAILLAIGRGEACVCHLEAILEQRQAYISQHLMALRAAGLLESRKEGRFVYYWLKDPALLEVIRLAWQTTGGETGAFKAGGLAPVAGCPCPHCAAGWVGIHDIDILNKETSNE